jgi:hypothetical protein
MLSDAERCRVISQKSRAQRDEYARAHAAQQKQLLGSFQTVCGSRWEMRHASNMKLLDIL